MDLLILGASARAAAFSALRIGLRPTCIDLFADADLVRACPAARVDHDSYPDGLASLALDLPPMPWMYTGAIENRPDLVDLVSTRHTLLGNGAEVVRTVRNPLALAEAAKDLGLHAPGVRLEPGGLPVDGSWLRKPIASAGGRGIAPWVGKAQGSQGQSYYQERIKGLPLAATFVGDSSRTRCLGITRQFVGKAGNRFAYRGSLAPWPVSDEIRERVERLGWGIADRFGLVGLFGIDLILKDGQPYPIEVNPRYSASVEVLELASGRSLLFRHLNSCGLDLGDPEGSPKPCNETFAAKAILFADRALRWPSGWEIPKVDPRSFLEIADIPYPGTEFRPGDPVVTVFARGDSPEQCRRALAARLVSWRRQIRGSSETERADRPLLKPGY